MHTLIVVTDYRLSTVGRFVEYLEESGFRYAYEAISPSTLEWYIDIGGRTINLFPVTVLGCYEVECYEDPDEEMPMVLRKLAM